MQKKIALVTGASSGIGKAVAVALAAAGYTMAITARRRDALDETAAEIASLGGEVLAHPADVTDPQSVEELFGAIRDRFGRLDVLFNNAGVNAPEASIDNLDVAEWKRVIDTNLTGVFLCARQAFAIMKAQAPRGGRIINNGSISAHTPRPGSAAYTASKHGVLGLTKQIALDGRDFDIACSQIDIGNVATQMTERMGAGVTQADGTKAIEPRFALRHVADAVVYMANLPLDANTLSMTVMATKMPFVGRG